MEKIYISVTITYYPGIAPDAYYYKNDGANTEFYKLDLETACAHMSKLLSLGARSESSINPYNKAITTQKVTFFDYL